ncbi:MAG: PQQ-binding-like beta-propeller repeat protein [Spirochaetaceae bacterium]|nr:PQQ-binding-like beta-propeller repeat protein [Spirochaetaceae bacterium]
MGKMIRNRRLYAFLIIGYLAAGYVSTPVRAQSADEIANSLLWRQALGGSVLSTPSAQIQSVSLVCEGGFVRTYSDAGKQLWEYAAGGRLLPFIARSSTGITLFGRTNGYFYALNRAGRLLWEKRLGEALVWSPLIGWDGRIFVFLGKRIICFTATGTQLWEYALPAQISAQPVANTKGGFIAVLKNNTMLLASPFGEINPVELAAQPAAVLPGNYPDALVIYDDGDIETLKDGFSPKKVIQIRQNAERAASSGGKKPAGKQAEIPPELPAGLPAELPAPHKIGGRTVTAIQYKDYVAILLDTGNIMLWRLSAEQALWTKPAMLGINRARLQFDERGIYLFSMSGAAGWTTEGSLLWNMRIQGAAVPPVLSDDGILFYGATNWLLYAYKVEHRSRTKTAGISFPYNLPDEGNYGLGTGASAYQLFFDESGVDSVLKQIAKAVKNGNTGTGEPFAVRALLTIAAGGDTNVHTGIIEQLEALRLLGSIGSRETVPFLVHRLAAEQDPNVRAGIIEALGRIGVDPNQTVIPHFDKLAAQSIGNKNIRILSSLTEALGRLCRFSGPPVSDSGIKILVSISTSGIQPSAAQAQKELETLAATK